MWDSRTVVPSSRILANACTDSNTSIHFRWRERAARWPGHRDSRKHQRRWLEVFESVQAFAKIRLDGTTVLLSHMPYLGAGDHTLEERHTQFRLHDEGGWLIHGHTHQPERHDGKRSAHAGMDAWGLRPASEGEILDAFRECEEWRWRGIEARKQLATPVR